MKKIFVFLLLAALALPPAYGASMMSRGKHQMMMRKAGGGHFEVGRPLIDVFIAHQKGLNLSEEQIKTLTDIRSAHRKEADGLNVEMTALRRDLQDLYEADRIDYKAIGAKIAELDAVQSKLRSSYFNAMADADKVLTDEQRGKIKELIMPAR